MISEEDMDLHKEAVSGWESTHFEACTGGDLVRIQRQRARKFAAVVNRPSPKTVAEPNAQSFWDALDAVSDSAMEPVLMGKS